MAENRQKLTDKLHEALSGVLKYLEWKEPSDEPEGQPGEKKPLDQKRKTRLVRTGLICVAAVLLILLIVTMLGRVHYDSYDVVTSSVVEKTDNVSKYRSVDDEILRYSSDGASLLNKNLDSRWNVTYAMDHPEADACEGTIVIYDRDGTDVRVFDKKGAIGSFQADRPIIKAKVSKGGNVIILLRDNEALLRYYTSTGEEIASISSTMQTTGYPADFDLSENGLYLAVSYMAVMGDSVGTHLVFYDFSREGRAIADNVTAQADFPHSLIPIVYYDGNDRIMAVREDGFTVFRGKTPSESKSVDFDAEIVSTFWGDKRLGFIFRSASGDHRYDMKIYDENGALKVTAPVDIAFDDVTVSSGQVIFTNLSELGVYTMGGACRFEGPLDEGDISSVLRTGSRRYLVVTNSRTEMIHLT